MSEVIFVCCPLQAEVPDTEITRHPFCSVFQHSEKFTSMHARPCMWLDPIDRSRRIIRYGAPGRFVAVRGSVVGDWRYHGTGCRFSITLLRRDTVHLPAPVVRNRNGDAICGLHPTASKSTSGSGRMVSVRSDLHRGKLHREGRRTADRGRTWAPSDRARYKPARGWRTGRPGRFIRLRIRRRVLC